MILYVHTINNDALFNRDMKQPEADQQNSVYNNSKDSSSIYEYRRKRQLISI